VLTLDALRLVLANENSFIRYAGRPFSRGNAFRFINYFTSTVSLISRKVKTILANFIVSILSLIPFLNQSAIFVGFFIGSSTYFHIRLRRLFLAALISSLI